jgi:hypothetical protein
LTLPTFLGIGVPRAGTTWVHELLDGHPDVYVPTHRKEVRFFDLYYERGLQWYEKFFPPDANAGRYQAIGEISPGYLYCSGCPEHIAGIPSIAKLLLILRNPVDRAYSAYGRRIRYREFSGPFEDLLSIEPELIQLGFYSRKVKDYLRYFSRDQLLVLIYEHAVLDVVDTKETLAGFLGVAADRFPLSVGSQRVNRSYIPRARPVPHALTRYVAVKLRDWDLDRVLNLADRIERLLGAAGPMPPMEEETRQYLSELFADEVRDLESLLGIDLGCWK